MIRVGNQTACWAATPNEPFDYAVAHGFDAFEWFPDKKPGAGWDESDLPEATRRGIRQISSSRGMRLSVHARWQVNPLTVDSHPLLWKDLELAQDLGAALLNIHFFHEQGAPAFVEAIKPLIQRTREAGLQLSIENTPHHSPEQFSELFDHVERLNSLPTGHVGMCLDLGHANLCAATLNDYLAFVDRLDPRVPIIHLHLHENWGDADTHLPLFTGPAAKDDSGIRGLVIRLQRRGFDGSAIFEQWPHPPSLLDNARDRFLGLWRSTSGGPSQAIRGDHRPAAQGAPPKPPASNVTSSQPHTVTTAVPRAVTPGVASGGTDVRIPAAYEPSNSGPGSKPNSAASSPPPVSRRKTGTDVAAELAAGNQRWRSWREKLDFARSLLAKRDPALTEEQLVGVAIYLRFLGTGEIACTEDGRHFRPAHHARIAAQIQGHLASMTTPDNAYLVRKIYPWLPSSAPTFQRPEPLTRIRDIAHRNDIGSELKREIKTTLQNKLHRCAGPEDLATSAALLARITAPGSDYSPGFVQQFKIFHEELKEFFNATSLDEKLSARIPSVENGQAQVIHRLLDLKAGQGGADQKSQPSTPEAEAKRKLEAFRTLTTLREAFSQQLILKQGFESQELMLADIALEDFAFVLLSEIINAADEMKWEAGWEVEIEALLLAVSNLALSGVDAVESCAVGAELRAWGRVSPTAGHDELLRLKATLFRCRRLAEDFSGRILRLFDGRVEELGKALSVAHHAIRVFAESDIRGHIIFQVSKLVAGLLRRIRSQLKLPAWDVLVTGRAAGRVRAVASLDELSAGLNEPTLVLLKGAMGDEEITKNIVGLVLAHEMPHLSHLGVRARQAGVVFVACEDAAEFERLATFQGKEVLFTAYPDSVVWNSAAEGVNTPGEPASALPPPRIVEVQLVVEKPWIPVDEIETQTGGGKAYGARRLEELAGRRGSDFRTPGGFVVPFGTMESALRALPALELEYQRLVERMHSMPPDELASASSRLRELVQQLSVPTPIISEAKQRFAPDLPLVVRSSANCEDLEQLAGAGLYDSVINMFPADLESAIRTVWSSLWTRRAVLSRRQAGIPHEGAHMAVLVQEMVDADFSFVLHTANPITGDEREVYSEVVVGLGDTLVSAAARGNPYRMVGAKDSDAIRMLGFANFSHASRRDPCGGLRKEMVDYSQISLSRDADSRTKLGRRLTAIGRSVEALMGKAQDIEGAVVKDKIYLVQARPQVGLLTGTKR